MFIVSSCNRKNNVGKSEGRITGMEELDWIYLSQVTKSTLTMTNLIEYILLTYYMMPMVNLSQIFSKFMLTIWLY